MTLDSNEVQSVDTTYTKFVVYWMLGNVCTYKCSYCPPNIHSGSVPYHPLEIVQSTLRNLPTNTTVTLSGGEPTYHPEFEKIVLEKPDNLLIDILTNGSRPYAFWERIIDNLNTVTLSYHVEFTKLERFLETAKLIFHISKRRGIINLVMKHDRWAECIEVYAAILDAGLPVTAKPEMTTLGPNAVISFGYTEEQRVWLAKMGTTQTTNKIVILDKNLQIIDTTNPTLLLASNQNNFVGWECHASITRMLITPQGEVYDTQCKQRRLLGTIYNGFTIPTEPMICKTSTCWCYNDLQAKKVKMPIIKGL